MNIKFLYEYIDFKEEAINSFKDDYSTEYVEGYLQALSEIKCYLDQARELTKNDKS